MRESAPAYVQSVNVGRPREVLWKGRMARTSIFKGPVLGRVAIRRLNLEGDQQADLTVHGGPDKAVYVYPAEYYAFWREQFPAMELPWSMFGENLTIACVRDDAILIGDELQAGSARLVVTQPRMPCFKLALKFGRDDTSIACSRADSRASTTPCSMRAMSPLATRSPCCATTSAGCAC